MGYVFRRSVFRESSINPIEHSFPEGFQRNFNHRLYTHKDKDLLSIHYVTTSAQSIDQRTRSAVFHKNHPGNSQNTSRWSLQSLTILKSLYSSEQASVVVN
jgi:hypothetical protein